MSAAKEAPAPHDAWLELPGGGTFILATDCRIGRVEGNEIVNPDSRISRRNSVVQRQGNGFVLIDLGSTNGTYLNEQRIFKPTRLKDGDVILIGNDRYTFCQPVESPDTGDGPQDSIATRTVVTVGKVSCWLLLAVAPESAGAAAPAWLEELRQVLLISGAGTRRLRTTALLGHWRERRNKPEKIHDLILNLASLPRPPGAHLVLHHGAVRVSPGATADEENLLGAEVSFTHKLETAALDLGESFLLSEPAVLSLGLLPEVSALGSQALRDIPGTHPLFAFRQA